LKTKYEVRFTPSFSKNIRVLGREDQVKVFREINILKTDPYAGKPLRGDWKGVYSLRVGVYRVLYQVKGKEVLLLIVGHRKHVYG
jgi:mRNA interferase RelE/StbE